MTVVAEQKCKDSNFCTRLRGFKGAAFEILPKSIDVKGQTATARLRDSRSNAEFDLSLTAYDGVLRLRIVEPAKKRFEVPDVLLSAYVDAPVAWATQKAGTKSLQLQHGQATLTLQYQPFLLSVSVGGKLAIEINSRSLFGYEHLRDKQVRDSQLSL